MHAAGGAVPRCAQPSRSRVMGYPRRMSRSMLLLLLVVAILASPVASAMPAAAPPGSWPTPDWSTVPTYTFCGPAHRHFNAAELDFISGKSGAGYAPRWMALGYATLAYYPPVMQHSELKQLAVAQRIKAIAPNMPVWGANDWDLLLCDTPTNLTNKNATCLLDYDAEMRAHPEQLLHCGGQLVTRTANAGRAVHDWSNNGTRKAFAAALRAFRDSGYFSGMFWDGVQHRFNRAVEGSQDYPTGDGRTSAKCSSDDILRFHAGEVQMVKDGREAIGWENVTICNDGHGLGNWTFAVNDSDALLAGRPMCSGANFEFYEGEPMDVLGIYRMGRWSDTVQPYLAVIRGVAGGGTFARHLAGFLVAAGRHSYFLEYATYNCDDSNGKPPFTGSQLAYNPYYAKALGEPSPTEVHSVSVRSGSSGNEVVRETITGCGCLVGDGITAEGKTPPAGPSSPNPYVSAPSTNTTSLWLGTTDQRPPQGLVHSLTAGTDVCECVLTRKFASGTVAYYNATSWRVGAGIRCTMVPEAGVAQLGCPKGKTIDKIVFASYGTPAGSCKEGFHKARDSKGKICDCNGTVAALQKLCVGRQECSFKVSTAVFGADPCFGISKRLAAEVHCSGDLPGASCEESCYAPSRHRHRLGWARGGSQILSSQASCVLWADNTTLENAGGCSEARDFLAK